MSARFSGTPFYVAVRSRIWIEHVVTNLGAWRDWLEHDRYDAYWDEIAFNREMHRVAIPVFHVSGWYDDVLNGTLINFSALKSAGSPQKLLIGPWPHRLNTTSKFGEIRLRS